MSEKQQYDTYGRFGSSNRYHMDQIPMPVVFCGKRTLHLKGANDVAIRHPHGSGLDKRQCSLQLTIRAEGEQHIKPMLIFRGAGMVSRKELDFYESLTGIRCVCQSAAWADRRIMMNWLDGFNEDLGGSNSPGYRPEVMLGMDQHGSQCVDEFVKGMLDYNIYGVYTPVNCTDVAAPIDHHVGARIKNTIKGLYIRDFDAHLDQWTHTLTASDRRMHIAKWVAEAWDQIKDDAPFFKAVFQSTGFCNAKDGSENHLIKVGSEIQNYNIDVESDDDIF